jgi:hypothetical protein
MLFACVPPVTQASTINLSLTPLVSEMHVLAGAADRTFTEVTNNGDVEERITVEPIDWKTRLDGSISIERAGAEGTSSLTNYLQAIAYRFILQPHETRRLDVALSMPAGAVANKSYWGGLLIKATPLDGGLAIGPAATFFVYDNTGSPRRHVSLLSLRASPAGISRSTVLAAVLKNDGAAYARVAGTITVSRNGKVVNRQNIAVGAIFPGRRRIVEQAISGLAPGRYSAEVTFDFGGEIIVGGDTDLVVP